MQLPFPHHCKYSINYGGGMNIATHPIHATQEGGTQENSIFIQSLLHEINLSRMKESGTTAPMSRVTEVVSAAQTTTMFNQSDSRHGAHRTVVLSETQSRREHTVESYTYI